MKKQEFPNIAHVGEILKHAFINTWCGCITFLFILLCFFSCYIDNFDLHSSVALFLKNCVWLQVLLAYKMSTSNTEKCQAL